ncbi:axial regulator YABBY 4-like isoform X2 [Actinidia eriantha]|uniref:axial regulator YABBY 4-like isoform X2 n=1 Tax=Actinidia eriantha TaxID=165200 RepID=UPI00258B03DB|nr:axial regulator YABBY 4-like isoform X2 [Actinidia eriantha]
MWLLHHHFTGGVAILMFFAFICLLSSFLLYYFTFQIQVSVPYSSLLMGVTVRCGHCTSLLSVNVMKVSFIPLHLLTSLNQDEPKQEVSPELEADAEKGLDKRSPSLVISSDDEEDDEVPVNHIVNRPPEKRQRAPSAYNNFIKEEIRRLKAKYPNTTHKEAFSAAAKNWANFPPIQYKRDGESCGQGPERKMPRSSGVGEVHVEGNGFSERKSSRHSIWAQTPFE